MNSSTFNAHLTNKPRNQSIRKFLWSSYSPWNIFSDFGLAVAMVTMQDFGGNCALSKNHTKLSVSHEFCKVFHIVSNQFSKCPRFKYIEWLVLYRRGKHWTNFSGMSYYLTRFLPTEVGLAGLRNLLIDVIF